MIVVNQMTLTNGAMLQAMYVSEKGRDRNAMLNPLLQFSTTSKRERTAAAKISTQRLNPNARTWPGYHNVMIDS